MRFKNLMMGAMLLALAGCGCSDDSVLSSVPLDPESVAFGVGHIIPPCELTPPGETINQIDVFVVIDDSWSMNNKRMGLVPFDLTDQRSRTFVAQEVMKNLEDQILQDLADSYGQTLAEIEARFDFAFGVGFLCDFGGEFADTGRSFPQDVNARPFTLSMPVIRQKHPLFDTMFANAIVTDTPGDGRVVDIAQFASAADPQSSIEALYQIATGDGFDGDLNASTNDSGAPCAETTQLAPGDSGDVPAVTFSPTPDATDPDNRPVYYVRDSNGDVTVIEDPSNPGGTINCFASGNLGGVGWRNEAARFVILTSDVATISPFPGEVPEAVISSEPGTTPTVPAIVGPSTGPREQRNLPTTAFDSSVGRFGNPALDGLIAPTNANTVPDTIAALNNLHIEVLCMGYPTGVPNQAKPNGGFDPADTPPNDIPGTDVAPEVRLGDGANEYGTPTLFPWTFMSAVSVLSGSEINFANPTGAVVPLPAVYNAGTVWRPEATPDPTNINNHIREDLVQRIRDWVDNGYLNEVGGGNASVNPDDLPSITIPVGIAVDESAQFLTKFVREFGPTPTSPQTVSINVFVTGDANPGGTEAKFDLGYSLMRIDAPQVQSDVMGYQLVADMSGISVTQGSSGSDVSLGLFNQLRAKVSIWREAFGQERILTDASLAITLEEKPIDQPEAVPNEIEVAAVTEGCGFLEVVNGDPAGTQPVGAPCDRFDPVP